MISGAVCFRRRWIGADGSRGRWIGAPVRLPRLEAFGYPFENTGLNQSETGIKMGGEDVEFGKNMKRSNGKNLTNRKWSQIAAFFVASLPLFIAGTVIVWTSPALPDLKESGKFKDLTTSDTSWIASIMTLGAVLCGPPTGFVLDRFGRKMCLLVLSIPNVVGWAMIAFAPSVVFMMVGRFILGFCIGGFTLASSVYIAEISEPEMRGMALGFTYINLGSGKLLTYVLGAFLSWFQLTLIMAALAFILVILILTLPESPIYLINNGNLAQTEKVLMRLRGKTEASEVGKELKEMQLYVEELEEAKRKVEGTLWSNLLRRGTMKAVSISFVLAMIQQFSGVNAVNFYTANIFAAANAGLDPNVSAIIVGADILFSTIVQSQVSDRLGRRKLLMISQLGQSICLIALGSFFFAYRENVAGPSTSWIPLASLVLFLFFYMIGIGPLAWGIMGEVLPVDVKGPASAAVSSFSWFLAFVVTKTFEDLVNLIGIHTCFWIFGGCSALGLVYCILFIPETRGKSLEEIQKRYFS